MNQKGFAPIFIILFITIISSAAVIYHYLNIRNNPPRMMDQIFTVLPNAPPHPGATTLTLHALSFTIPKDWWYKKDANNSFPLEWYYLNSTAAPNNIPYPVFQISVEKKDTTLESYKESLIKTFWLKNVEEDLLLAPGSQGMEIKGFDQPEGVPNPATYANPFGVGTKVGFTFFIVKGEVYLFEGNLSQDESDYNQILSTFTFASQLQTSNNLVLDFSNCVPGSGKINTSGKSDTYQITGEIINNKCIMNYGENVESSSLKTATFVFDSPYYRCEIPKELGVVTFTNNQSGLDLTRIKQYCIQ